MNNLEYHWEKLAKEKKPPQGKKKIDNVLHECN